MPKLEQPSAISSLDSKLIFRIFNTFANLFSAGGALSIFLAALLPVTGLYIFFFLYGFSPENAYLIYQNEIDSLWKIEFISLILQFIFFGGGTKWGLPSPFAAIRTLNTMLTQFKSAEISIDHLKVTLIKTTKIPVFFSTIFGIIIFFQWLSLVVLSVVNHYDLKKIFEISLGYIYIFLLISGAVFIISDFLFGYYRVQLKAILHQRGEQANDCSIGKRSAVKLTYLAFLNFTSTILIIFFLLNHPGNFLSNVLAFTTITFMLSGSLIYAYYYTWQFSVRQISDATYELAMGGSGFLPILSTDRELVEMSGNFDHAAQEINTIRKYLTNLVNEKTKTVSDALEETKKLKVRQDGDYYLTANLIEPLSIINPQSENIQVDSYIRQYKVFEFMGVEKDIGGDLNAAYPLHLQGEKYTLVINADAMGKSLQGAGGVLVLGSALRALIERTKFSPEVQLLSPERWLKNAFLEMHRLFSSFNGTMMASLICIMIHDQSGYCIIINAEHPKGVLYRNGVSRYISTREGLRKLGNLAIKGRLWVDAFQLQDKDIIIFGSDGREDLILGYDKDRQPIMNEDENFFLDRVQNAAGDIPKIVIDIRQSGEIVDDLSLLRIEYSKKVLVRGQNKVIFDQLCSRLSEKTTTNKAEKLLIYKNILDIKSDDIAANRFMFVHYASQDNYLAARAYINQLVNIRPSKDSYLYAAALLEFRLNNLDLALMYSDRLALRNSRFERNLILLGKIQQLKKNADGVREVILLLREIRSDHEFAQELFTSLA